MQHRLESEHGNKNQANPGMCSIPPFIWNTSLVYKWNVSENWRLAGWSCWGKWLRVVGKDSHPEDAKERELRLRYTNKKYHTHNKKKNNLRNVIRSQYLKYIGHVCRCPNTMMAEKMLFAKLKRPHQRDPWINISRGVNVSIEQAQRGPAASEGWFAALI